MNPTPALPSKAGTYILIENEYAIHVETDGDYIALRVGYTKTGAGIDSSFPTMARKRTTTFEFKHYHHNGSKSWTKEPGTEFVFILPRSEVKLVRENGYSYPKVIINECEVQLNTSGGGGKVWTDFIGEYVCTSINLPLATLSAIASVAVRGTELDDFKFYDEQEEEFYQANDGKYLTVCAWGDWHKRVPEGYVGLATRINGHRSNDDSADRYYLVATEEYHHHRDTSPFSYVIDPARVHPWTGPN